MYLMSASTHSHFSWQPAALTLFFGADNVDGTLKIHTESSDGEDIRPVVE